MSRQVFIHIGTHKTGTTSIQAMLRQRAFRLSKIGIHVPLSGCPFPAMGGHHNIAWMLRKDPRANPAFGCIDALARELSETPATRAVISAEGMEYLVDQPALITTLEETLSRAGWSVRYILFLREPSDYAISLYHEMCKSGLRLSFDDFVEGILTHGRHVQDADKSFYFDYEAFVARWQSASHAPIDIHSFEAARAGAGVVEAFLRAIGVSSPEMITAAARTPRMIVTRWFELMGLKPIRDSNPDLNLNVNTAPVSDDMRMRAARLGTAFGPGFRRLIGTTA